ncbi:MAG: phosphatidate cytidylyltransferase [Oscillospiraceae bacterium]|nr:phosphatidate cytidylyltransferase [Oscillospiraceae bacterium]
MAVPVIITLLFGQVIGSGMKTTVTDIIITVFGICYIVGFMLFIPLIHSAEHGKFLIWYIFLAAWGTDTFAYFVGVKFGKHKFTKASPKKSIEGSIGGTVGAVIICLIYTLIINGYTDVYITYWYIAIVAFVFSILGQLGDLAASCIKRYAEIKDFSELIPGHGGVLDRIDSILFLGPFAYLLLIYII